MNKEILFAQTLEQVRKTAREQGNCISEEQVKDAFAELDLSGEQLQMVFDYLLKHKIGIGQPMDPDEFLTDEEKDYLQEYLDEVAELPTYTDGEKLAFAMSAMAGEADAQQRLIEIHLADVAELAKLYAGQGVLLEDLVGEGNLALSFGVTMLGSLEKPQEVEGMLGKMIMDAMEEYIAEHAENSKIDKRVEDKVNKVADKARELAEELQRKVTIEELDRKSRQKNLKKAFKIGPYDVKLSRVLLVDDIFTTGSTVDAAAAVLKEAGAEAVFFLTACIGTEREDRTELVTGERHGKRKSDPDYDRHSGI